MTPAKIARLPKIQTAISSLFNFFLQKNDYQSLYILLKNKINI
jgi:hypothetical protein